MKKITLLFFLLVTCLSSIKAQKYYHLIGTINGNLPVVMDLMVYKDKVEGSYFYETIGQEIELRGKLTSGESLSVSEYVNDNETGQITIQRE
ncbi:MAG: hypothetical protein NZ108_10185, partial [Bacteroidia bacterium]|nr:hypothetical protein [Bacteroidia bacterium]